MRGSLWRRLVFVTFGQGVQFQCRLFLLVQALIFGAHAVHWCLDEVSLLAARWGG